MTQPEMTGKAKSFFSAESADRRTGVIGFFAKRPFVVCCFALLIGACVKILALNSRELWLDETFSAYVANLPFAQLLNQVQGDYHPPLYYIFLWLWVRIVGDTQGQLRLLSVLISICGSFGMFFLAKRVLGARFAVLAATLFAFSPMLFVYSLEVRMYMLSVVTFVCLLTVHWIVVIEQNSSKWLVVAYSILASLQFYIHYIGVFLLLGLFVHWAISAAFVRGRLVRLVSAGLLTLLFVSPWIPVMLHQRAGSTGQSQALRLSYQNRDALGFGKPAQNWSELAHIKDQAKGAAAMAGFFPASSPALMLLCAVPLMASLAGIGFLAFVKGDQVCLLFVIVAISVGLGMVTLHSVVTRFMLPLVPLLVLAISRAVQYGVGTARWRVTNLTVGALILCLYVGGFFRQASVRHGHPWRNLVSAVQQDYRPGDRVIFSVLYSQVPFDYFARHLNFEPQESGFPISIYEWWGEQRVKAWGGPVIVQSDLDQFASQIEKSRPGVLWLVLYETNYYDPYNTLVTRLGQMGKVTEFNLPPDPDAKTSTDSTPLRLVRIALNR